MDYLTGAELFSGFSPDFEAFLNNIGHLFFSLGLCCAFSLGNALWDLRKEKSIPVYIFIAPLFLTVMNIVSALSVGDAITGVMIVVVSYIEWVTVSAVFARTRNICSVIVGYAVCYFFAGCLLAGDIHSAERIVVAVVYMALLLAWALFLIRPSKRKDILELWEDYTVCDIEGHVWKDCKCAVCGEKLPDDSVWHQWKGCTCEKCGVVQRMDITNPGKHVIKQVEKVNPDGTSWISHECEICGQIYNQL